MSIGDAEIKTQERVIRFFKDPEILGYQYIGNLSDYQNKNINEDRLRQYLRLKGYTFRDIKMENPTYEELSVWHRRSGLPLKKFFNTSGLLYKSMALKEKLPEMSEDEMLKLLAADGMLVKRPLLVGDDFVLVGFKEAEWESCLKTQ